LAVAVLGWAAPSPGVWGASEAQKVPTLSPAVMTAVGQLSAEDFTSREKAVSQLQAALGQELRAIAEVQDPEAQARIGDLLAFEEGLAAWAGEVMKLPRDKQKAMLDLGLRADVLPHVAGLYMKDVGKRLDAVKALGKIADAGVTDLLAKALEDPEQQVYVAAMEAVWDRQPTDAVVEALWVRAVTAQFATMRPQPVDRLPANVTFRGKSIPVQDNGDNTMYLRMQDNTLATDVLAHLQAPGIGTKLKALFEEVEAAYSKKNPNGVGGGDQDVWMYMPTQESMKNAARLAEAYKPKEIVPVLYRIATGPALQKSSGQMGRGQTFYWSNRTWAVVLTLKLTGQPTEVWNIKAQPNLSNMWTLPGEADEHAVIAKLREWWKTDHEKWGGGPDTRPEEPDNVPVVGGGVKVLPMRE